MDDTKANQLCRLYAMIYNRGKNSGHNICVAKACEWLRNNWRKYINIDADGVVCFGHWDNDFRKAMKGKDYDSN